jgi:diguanylate cyclase
MATQASGLGSAVRGFGKLFGTRNPEDAIAVPTSDESVTAAPLPADQIATAEARRRSDEAAAELDRYRAILANVSAFLLEHAIEPLPDHYQLAYRHRIAGEPGLGQSVAALIRDGHATIDAIGENDSGLSVALLASLVQQAQQQLEDVAALARRSGEEAREYGQALESNIAELAPTIASHPVLGSLVGLTQMMIEKTNAAEAQMRNSASQMDVMRGDLDQAREQAETDALTGLFNRRAFERELGAATERAKIHGTPLSIAFCDIDHFKQINDTHGHDIGDRVLSFVGKVLVENAGKRGIVARHGGEEFVFLFDGMAPEDAYEIVDIARYDLAKRNIIDRHAGQPIGTVTFSAGVAALGIDSNISHMLRRADRALYRAKREGRNRVLLADNDIAAVNPDRPLP